MMYREMAALPPQNGNGHEVVPPMPPKAVSVYTSGNNHIGSMALLPIRKAPLLKKHYPRCHGDLDVSSGVSGSDTNVAIGRDILS